MIKLCMLVHRKEEVHHFQHPEVWKDDTVFGYLDHQSDFKDALQPEVCPKIMHKHYLERIVVAQNIKVQIHLHQVSIFNISQYSNVTTYNFSFQKKLHFFHVYFVEVVDKNKDNLKYFQHNFHQPNGLILRQYIYIALEHKQLIV